MSSSGTSISSAAVSRRATSRSASSSASACLSVRGKPSSRKPSEVSASPRRSRITAMMTSSGTSSPRSMYAFASLPRSVWSLTAWRSMSPVAMYASGKSSCRRSACVPFPAPGGPSRMRFSSAMAGRAPYLFQEALVVAHHQLGLELFHRVQRHADDDEQRGPAEEEVRARLVDEDRRQGGDRGEVERPREREAGEDAVEELGGRAPRSHAGDEPAVLLQVVGLIDRVERDRRVEVREEDDQDRLAEDVRRARRAEEVREVRRPGLADELTDRRRERHERRGEDDRDDAGHVDPQRQVGLAAGAHAPPDHALGVLDRDAPLALLDEDDRGDDAQREERHADLEDLVGVRPPRLHAVREARDDRREDHQRDPVADAALGDELAHPHEQHRARGERDHDEEHVRRVEVRDDRRARARREAAEQEDVADRLGEREADGEVARVLRDPRLADLALLLQLLECRHDDREELQDDRRRDVRHDPEREQRDAAEPAAAERVQQVQDAAVAELLLDRVDGVDVDPRDRDVRAEAVEREQQGREGELLADLGDRQRSEDRRRHRPRRLAARPRRGRSVCPRGAARLPRSGPPRRRGAPPPRPPRAGRPGSRARADAGAGARSGPAAAARTSTAAGRPPLASSAIATPGDSASTSAPAIALPAATPATIPVCVHVNASVSVPAGARWSSMPFTHTSVGAIVAPASSSTSARASSVPAAPIAAWAALHAKISAARRRGASAGAPMRATATPASIEPTPQKPSSRPVRSR